MTAIFSRRVKTSSKLLTSFLLLGLQLQIPTGARAQTQGSKQHFVCNVGYTPNDCLIAMTAFRKVLARYPAGDLGDWTWVLVRSEDWKRILLERGLNPDSPAFSYLPKRETFFDGSLVVGVSSRGAELSATWHMSIEDLFDLAIRHEIAHGLCNERNETRVGLAAIALKDRKPLTCQAVLVAQVSISEERIHR